MEYYATPDTISIAAGTIDEGSVVGDLPGPTNHIFVADKAPWFKIPNDGLERYDGFPDGMQTAIDRWSEGKAEREMK